MRTWVGAKLHGVRVTDASVDYHGSVGIDAELMATAGIEPFEQVHVVNLNTGGRWVTYALPVDQRGAFTLNGGGARLGVVGDTCVVMTYRTGDEYEPASVLFFDVANRVTGRDRYEQ